MRAEANCSRAALTSLLLTLMLERHGTGARCMDSAGAQHAGRDRQPGTISQRASARLRRAVARRRRSPRSRRPVDRAGHLSLGSTRTARWSCSRSSGPRRSPRCCSAWRPTARASSPARGSGRAIVGSRSVGLGLAGRPICCSASTRLRRASTSAGSSSPRSSRPSRSGSSGRSAMPRWSSSLIRPGGWLDASVSPRSAAPPSPTISARRSW